MEFKSAGFPVLRQRGKMHPVTKPTTKKTTNVRGEDIKTSLDKDRNGLRNHHELYVHVASHSIFCCDFVILHNSSQLLLDHASIQQRAGQKKFGVCPGEQLLGVVRDGK